MDEWLPFWDQAADVFASVRHRQAYFGRIASMLARFIPASDARVLDFGCGESEAADRIADRCAGLVLCDPGPQTRARLRARFAGNPKIEVAAPEDLAGMADASFSLICVNSVVQYLSREDLAHLLPQWRRLLKKGGSLVISDVLPAKPGMGSDLGAFLGFALKEGFFIQALTTCLRTALSPYARLRRTIGLTTYDESEMLALLEAARLPASRVRPNVGYNQERMAFQAFRLR